MSNSADGSRVLDPDDRLEDDTESGASGEKTRMSFLDHLDELRKRILYSVYALAVMCCVTFWKWEAMYVYLVGYFQRQGGHLVYNRPMGAFMFSMKLSMLAALILAAPFVFTQIWLFVAPGLYSREKKLAIPFVFFSTLLFAAGTWFAHFIAFPSMWKFFVSYNGLGGMESFQNIDDTFTFYVGTVLGLGLVFQMPLLVFVLSRFGMVSAGFLWKHFKYAVLAIFVLAAVITPSADIMTQLVFAVPMLVLYIVSIFVALIFGKRKRETESGD
jgi:sec-independent protein translocase protein TatC